MDNYENLFEIDNSENNTDISSLYEKLRKTFGGKYL